MKIDQAMREEAQRLAAERKFSQKDDVLDVTANSTRRILNEKDLVEFLNVDTEEWEVAEWRCGRWEVGMKIKTTEDGVRIENPHIQDLWTIAAKFKRRVKYLRHKNDIAHLIEEMKAHSPKYKKPDYRAFKSNDRYLLVMSLFDHHLGKLVWGQECGGQDYDTAIAAKLFITALEDILAKTQSFPIDRILFPIGNDFYNIDNFMGETTAGTRQDQDSRWVRMYQEGRVLLVKALDIMRLIAPVDVVIVPGNHDEHTAWCVGDALHCWYNNDKSVEVDMNPHPTKYYSYGQTMFALTHGKDIRPERLPGVMSTEQSEMWASCRYKEGLVGHLHHKRETVFMPTQELGGVRVRQMPSLVSNDAYHARHGYVGSLRAAQGLLYHANNGYEAEIAYNPRSIQESNAPIIKR